VRHVRAAWTVLVVIVLAATAGCTHHDAVAPPTSTAAASTAPVSTSTPTPTPTETQDSNIAAAEAAFEAFIDAYNAAYNNHLRDWRATVLPLTGGEFQKTIETELSGWEGRNGWAEGGMKIIGFPSEVDNNAAGEVYLQVCIDDGGVIYHYDSESTQQSDRDPSSDGVTMRRQPGGSWIVWSRSEGDVPCG